MTEVMRSDRVDELITSSVAPYAQAVNARPLTSAQSMHPQPPTVVLFDVSRAPSSLSAWASHHITAR